MDSSRCGASRSLGLLILRLGIGGFMASHGWGKLQMAIAGKYDEFPALLGLSKQMSLYGAAFGEFVCAILVAVGLCTRFAAIPAAFTMAVAAFVVHKADPLSAEVAAKAFLAGTSKSWAAKEHALLFLIPFLALVFTGAGGFSLDALFFSKRKAPKKSPSPTP